MKKLLTLLLLAAFVLVFAGCDNDMTENKKSVQNQSVAETEKEDTNATDNTKTKVSENQNDNNATLQGDKNTSQGASDKTNKTNETNKTITKAKAKQIALSDAKVKASKIRDFEIELDREGKYTYYEINFEAGGYEYEYDIDAKSGKILKKHKEKED